MASKEKRLINSLTRKKPEARIPIAQDMYLPNQSGDHSKGRVNTTPSNDTDLVNKKYVDDTHSSLTAPITLENSTASTAFTIDQNSSENALVIDSEATSSVCIDVATVETIGKGLQIIAPSLTSGNAIFTYSTGSAFSSTTGLIRAYIDHASATGVGIGIQNDGTGAGLKVDQNGAGSGIDIDHDGVGGRSISSTNTTDGNVFHTYTGTGGAGHKTFLFRASGVLNSGDGMLYADMSNSSSTVPVIRSQNSGTGSGILIDQNGNGQALLIDTESTSVTAFEIAADATTTGNMMYAHSTSFTTGTGFLLDVNNATYSSNTGILFVRSDHASSTGRVAQFVNDGTGVTVNIDHNGASGDPFVISLTTQDIGMINFVATEDADATSALSSLTTSGAITGHIQVEINGVSRWIAHYADPS